MMLKVSSADAKILDDPSVGINLQSMYQNVMQSDSGTWTCLSYVENEGFNAWF